ncbi:MAG: hypothetical protein M0R76_14595 [Proteobacteria bacterium]|nr:hypothetical protein [Pseudomonadota bacterium]
MDKVTKRVLFVLIIVALALPMFIGCDGGGAEPPATDYRALLLSELKTEVSKSSVATLDGTWEDLTVTFSSSDFPTVYSAAVELVNTFKNKVSNTSELILGEGDGNTFTLETENLLSAVKDKIFEMTNNLADDPFEYTVNVKGYKGQNFTLTGDVTIEGVELD